MLKHFEMYIMVNNFIGKKRIDLTYLIKNSDLSIRRLQLLACLVATFNMSSWNLGIWIWN